ncbi:MAG: trypsin-like peptidase domain-containing protein [Paludisphaera borealis]|uniref:trypsin-like peptidase domain-containing protein n=1 Tax=Paludisphaera borealis TaxID=1387353 RepID=UPI002842D056|nr:trypsin-like peptidase domain-containing protein [Paludisphaera borealis]MDR3621354.1 trypsin-like peptidase domain-containing protein [Paludisphaera borealis]
MLTRPASIMLVAGSVSIGLVMGFWLGRGGGSLSAQVGGAATATGRNPVAAEVRRVSQIQQSDVKVYEELAKQYDQFRHVDRMFEQVSKAVAPTVVHIITQKSSRHEEGQKARKFEETGSGVIVRCDKLAGLFVLTNHHVVEGGKSSKIRVYLQDGRALTPERIWSDSMADIAVLKLDRDDLPAARLGDSDNAQVGSWVLALGSPFGLTHSVSQGIISARGRHMDELRDVDNQDFLQTDAAINPGNSGGPLVNMLGEVVGINNSIASNGGGNEGVGFSIPINLARWIMNELIANGHVTRGGLGVELDSTYDYERAVKLGLDRPNGALIGKVHPDSPASRGGVQEGDVILSFGGVSIHDLNHLVNAVSMSPVGRPAEVVVWRDRHELKLRLTVGDRDRALPAELDPSQDAPPDPSGLVRRPNRPGETSNFAMGLEVVTLSTQLAARFGLPDSMHGACVVSVDAESPFVQLCRVNDVIATINERPVASAEQAVRMLGDDGSHTPLIISIDRLEKGEVERHTIRVPR